MEYKLMLLSAVVACCALSADAYSNSRKTNGSYVQIAIETYRYLEEVNLNCPGQSQDSQEYNFSGRKKRSIEDLQSDLEMGLSVESRYNANEIEEFRKIGVPIAVINNPNVQAEIYALNNNWLNVKNFHHKIYENLTDMPVQIKLVHRDEEEPILTYSADYSELQSNDERNGSYFFVEEGITNYEKIKIVLKDGDLGHTQASEYITAIPPSAFVVFDPIEESPKSNGKSGPMVFLTSRALVIEELSFDPRFCHIHVFMTAKKKTGDISQQTILVVSTTRNVTESYHGLYKQDLHVRIPYNEFYDVEEMTILCDDKSKLFAVIKIPEILSNWILPQDWIEFSPPDNRTFKSGKLVKIAKMIK